MGSLRDGPFGQRPSPCFRAGSTAAADRSARRSNGASKSAFGHSELPFGLVDRSDQVVSFASEVPFGHGRDPRPVLGDVVGHRGELVGSRLDWFAHPVDRSDASGRVARSVVVLAV